MNRLGLIIALMITAKFVIGKVYRIHQGYCKKKEMEMEIISGDKIPEGFAVM